VLSARGLRQSAAAFVFSPLVDAEFEEGRLRYCREAPNAAEVSVLNAGLLWDIHTSTAFRRVGWAAYISTGLTGLGRSFGLMRHGKPLFV
jgi:hypothetical protein